MTEQKLVICPYCGDPQALADRCRACGGLFEPLSRQATHNAMGPWFVRDADRPFQPGCSYETLLRLVERGRVTKFTIVRGPTTRQFWTIAKHVPGLSHLLGFCHQCDATVDAGDRACHACGAAFGAFMDRNYLGLPDVRPLPWEAAGDDALRSQSVKQHEPMWRRPSEDDNEPRTISSFVSDEELLGKGGGGPLPSSFGGSETATERERSGTVLAEHPQAVQEVQQRTTRRTAARKRPTNSKPLVFGAVGVAVVIVIGSLAWLNSAGQPTDSTQPTETHTGEAASDGVETLDPAVDDERVQQTQRDLASLRADYDRALGLIESASDDTRSLSDRIADYQRALDWLMAFKEQAPEANWPDDLQERIHTTRAELDRLRLREFFP